LTLNILDHLGEFRVRFASFLLDLKSLLAELLGFHKKIQVERQFARLL
jgi:hypothetical protein